LNNIINIYTDGACIGNPGPGGWAALIIINNKEELLFGNSPSTTNNRMEMLAVIHAIESIGVKSNLIINTDSKYIINGISTWIKIWKKSNWLTSNKNKVKNMDLWKKLDHISSKHVIRWEWIKGHSGNVNNEKVDTVAREQALKLSEN